MDTSTRQASVSAGVEVSLVRGGLFYRLQQGLGLLRPNHWNLGRRIVIFVAVAWLPLVLITAVVNRAGLFSLLTDYRVYSRLLIAIPVLLIGELLMESRFRMVMGHIWKTGLLDAPELEELHGTVRRLVRVRDSFVPEMLIVLLMVVHTLTSFRGLVDTTPWLAQSLGGELQLTAAGWYAVIVSASIFQLLLGVALWRWLLWTYFMFRLSRRNLKLVATHPDEHGGLGFLGLTAAAFAPIAFAATAVIAATWRQEILYHGAGLMSFKLPAIALLVIVAGVALGPLVFFMPRLAALRRKGILEYGILGQLHSLEYHEKWIVARAGHESEFLQAPESSTLADYSRIYEKIEALKPFPMDIGTLYTLAAAVAIPALPVVLAVVPISVVLEDLLKALR
jgi:hypothetical protein